MLAFSKFSVSNCFITVRMLMKLICNLYRCDLFEPFHSAFIEMNILHHKPQFLRHLVSGFLSLLLLRFHSCDAQAIGEGFIISDNPSFFLFQIVLEMGVFDVIDTNSLDVRSHKSRDQFKVRFIN